MTGCDQGGESRPQVGSTVSPAPSTDGRDSMPVGNTEASSFHRSPCPGPCSCPPMPLPSKNPAHGHHRNSGGASGLTLEDPTLMWPPKVSKSKKSQMWLL